MPPVDVMDRSQSQASRPAKVSKEQHFEAYHTLRQRMKNQLKEAAKGQGTRLSLDNIDELTNLYSILERDHVRDTKVHLEDSEVFKEASGFAALNAKNLRFGDSGIALNESDVLKRIKKWAATDEAVASNQVGINGLEGMDDDDDDDDDDDPITDELPFNQVNWLKLGSLYHQLSKKPVSVDFLYGPLANEKRKVAARARNVDDTTRVSTSTTAKSVAARDIQHDEEKNTAYMVRLIYETFLSKDDGDEISFYKFFIDPDSFAQSVENLFYTSFLIKDGRLKLSAGDDGRPYVKKVSQKEIQENKLDSSNLFSSHHIATFSYDVWQRLIEENDIRDSFLGHRDEVEDQMPSEDLDDDFNDFESRTVLNELIPPNSDSSDSSHIEGQVIEDVDSQD
ncbi:uncharacterized protein LODBEIA_P49120 [Lodderomyces beijingensis]|uniref:Non-structural maintenance of chromosomes element 4 n=1 Tax=Lodderomyces beijingensis TaxID=1775926 RepID=A0ABP0ZR96_9ASCO